MLKPDSSPILKVFVGCEPEQALPFEVLRHSIQSRAPEVEVVAIHSALGARGISVNWELPPAVQGRTPFSFQRFAVPELADYQGTAIYLDSDMLVFDDIHRMLDHVNPAADITAAQTRPGNGRRPQISVLVFDAERARFTVGGILERLAAGEMSYDELFYKVPVAQSFQRSLPCEWNDLEHYDESRTKLVHFTDMDQQPWLTTENPLTDLWVSAVRRAVEQEAITLDFVRKQVLQGNARPSLLVQLEHGLSASQLKTRHRLMDFGFVPPHRVGFTMQPTARRRFSQLAIGSSKDHPNLLNTVARFGHGFAYRAMKHLKGGNINIK